MRIIKFSAIILLLFCGLQIISASNIPVTLQANLPAGTTWTIRLSDITEIPTECSNMTPVVDPFNEPNKGIYIVRNGAIVYISTLPADAIASDQFVFSINCNTNTYTVTANVNIVPKPDNILNADCSVPPEATVWKIDGGRNLGEVSTYVTALVGDMNGDGYPEIVTVYQLGTTFNALPSGISVPSSNFNSHFAQQIKVFEGPNHSDPVPFRTVYPFCVHGTGIMGIVKTKIETYPGSGIEKDSAIIVVGEGDFYMRAYSMTGDLIWTSSDKWTDLTYSTARDYLGGSLSASISFADFNNDGFAEVYVGNRIFDAATGTLLIKGTENSGKGGEYSKIYMTIAANMYGNERLELVAGNQIYDVVITNRTGTAGNSMTVGKSITPPICTECEKSEPIQDGYAFVADIDGDGYLDVVVATLIDKGGTNPVNNGANKSPFIYVWSPHKDEILAQAFIPNSDRMGTPFIGDVDGCGKPEILFSAGTLQVPNTFYVYAYKYIENGEVIPVTNVYLNKNTTSLPLNSTEQLTAIVMPSYATNKNVTWSSSNPSVATVSATGLVTPVAVGETTITVTTQDGNKTAQCVVTVTAASTVPSGIIFTFEDNNIGQTYTTVRNGSNIPAQATVEANPAPSGINTSAQSLKQVVEFNNTVIGFNIVLPAGKTWEDVTEISFDLYCATNENDPIFVGINNWSYAGSNGTSTTDPYLWNAGQITNAGAWKTITIPVAIINNNIAFDRSLSEFTLYLGVNHESRPGSGGDGRILTFYYDNIKVVLGEGQGPVAVTGVSLNKNTTSLTVGATEQLTATVAPSNAANKNVTWSSSFSGAAWVSGTGLVTAVGAGTTTITATTADGSFTDVCVVTVSTAPSNVLTWGVNNGDANISKIGTNNHVLELKNPAIPNSAITQGIITVNYAPGNNATSTRRFTVWTDLSGSSPAILDHTFATNANLTAGLVARTNPVLPATATVGTVTIPGNLLYNTTTNTAATKIFICLNIDNANADLETNQRGGNAGSGKNEFSLLSNITLTLTPASAPMPSPLQSTSGINELQLFWKLSHTDVSLMTGLTLFDFNQDGVAEILYRDETTLRIINGSGSGTNPSQPSYINPITKLLTNYELAEPIACISGTGHEYPTIADVDGDGQAEIIVAGSAGGPAAAPNGQLRIFKTAGSPWAPARPVWNQFAYNSVNVNDDLSLPKHQLNIATVFAGQDQVLGTADDVRPFNAFLQQSTTLNQYGVAFVPGPDISFASGFSVSFGGSNVSISFDVINVGEGHLPLPFFITVYKEKVGSANILQTINYNPGTGAAIAPGETVNVSFTIPIASLSDVNNLIISLNDNGYGFVVEECYTGNNRMLISFYDDFYGFAYNPGQAIALDILQNDMDNTRAVFMNLTGLPTSTAGSTLAILPDNGSGRQRLNYTPPVGFFGIDTLTYSATGKNASNIDTPTSAKVYIYIFEDSTLVCLPEVGVTNSVNIKIEDKKNDVAVNFFYQGTDNSANELLVTNPLITPVALRAEVMFNVSNDHLTHAFNNDNIPVSYKLEVVPPLLYWNWTSGKPSDNNWNNPANWLLEDGTPANAVPKLCTVVHIPGEMEKNFYPSLDSLNTVRNHRHGDPECDSIYFHFGGEVKETHRLTYTGAHVEMKLNSNQWYMLSAPLNNTYSGDFYIDNHNPIFDVTTPAYPGGRGLKVYMEHFDIANYQTGAPRIPYNWNNAFNTNDIEIQPGQGFAVFANPRYSTFSDQTALNGKTFWFPKNDPVHYYHDGAGNELYPGGALSRTKSHRFIYEDIIDETGFVPLNHSSLSEGQMVLVGNPFMAQLNFDAFVTDANNSSLIYDEYKIAYGVNTGADGKKNDFSTYKRIGGEWYTSDPQNVITSNYIAPMQSFIVHAKPGVLSSDKLKANIVKHTATAPTVINNTLRSSKQGQTDKELLYVTATHGTQKNHAVLVHWSEGTKNFRPEEDSRKLFDEKSAATVLVYLLSKDGIALDINTTDDLTEAVPIGIRTSKTGEITLSFSGMENFSNHNIYLIDAALGQSINLSDENEYKFTKGGTENYIEDRFFISFSTAPTGIINQKENQIAVLNPYQGTIQVISKEALGPIEIFDTYGRRLIKEDNINDTQYSYQASIPGIYIVRVMGEARKVIVK